MINTAIRAEELPPTAIARLLSDDGDASTAHPAVRSALSTVSTRRPGIALVQLPRGLSEPEYRRILLSVSAAFGRVLPQNATGETIREVRDRGTRIGEGATSRYSDSRFGGSPHTDGAECDLPVPDYFALLCVRQAESGGSLVCAHIDDVVDQLSRRQLATLQEEFHFDRRGDAEHGALTAVKPILSQNSGDWCVSYLREYIESGHRTHGATPLGDHHFDAFDALDRAAQSRCASWRLRMEPGQLVIIDNKVLLHGRETFTDGASRGRLLLRTWIGT